MIYLSNSAQPRIGSIQRLNWGCGAHIADGWINSDIKDAPGVDLVADIRKGLPLGDESMDCVVSVHALPEFSYLEIPTVLGELWRVLKPNGVLRLALPDLRKGIDAYLRNDTEYFQVDPREVKTPGGRFIVHMLWYGYSRTLFTPDFAEELLARSGFVDVRECAFGETASDFAEIADLDNRSEESFFLEGRKGRNKPRARLDLYNPRVAAQHSDLQILKLTHETPSERLRGHFRVEESGAGLEIVGWALGSESPVVQVEVVSGGEVLGSAPTVVERPDIATAFPDSEGADTAGFELVIQPGGKGSSHLMVQAELDNGERVPLGALLVATSRRRRKGLFRRGG